MWGGPLCVCNPLPSKHDIVYLHQMFRGRRKGKNFSPPLNLSHLLLGTPTKYQLGLASTLFRPYIMLLFHFLHPPHSRPKHHYPTQFDCSYFVIVVAVVLLSCYYCLLLLYVIIVCYCCYYPIYGTSFWIITNYWLPSINTVVVDSDKSCDKVPPPLNVTTPEFCVHVVIIILPNDEPLHLMSPY